MRVGAAGWSERRAAGRMWGRAAVAAVVAIASTACVSGTNEIPDGGARLVVESPDLVAGEPVPEQFTCDGENVPPRLRWSSPPDAAAEVLVVVDDPDAAGGAFLHWAVWGIDPNLDELSEPLPRPAVQGRNGFGDAGYGGPCPPVSDGPHTYRFRVLALDRPLGLATGTDLDDVVAAARGHVLGSGILEVTYDRPARRAASGSAWVGSAVAASSSLIAARS